MPSSFPPGPYKVVQTSQPGVTAPWYIVPFDTEGACTAPLTRAHLLGALDDPAYTDVFLFSHGWNNDWEAASERYESFIQGFVRMRGEHQLPLPSSFRPLLAGVFWPSTALVMPWERAPRFAGALPRDDVDARSWREELEGLAPLVDAADREDYYRLTQSPEARLEAADALRLAAIVSRAVGRLNAADGEVPLDSGPVEAETLIQRARTLPGSPASTAAPGSFGFASAAPGGAPEAPRAAFSLSDLDPRKLVRVATVLQMKDRAAVIGAQGVSPLLREILAKRATLRVHLVGHSYGAIVVLSAICQGSADSFPGQVESVLLLQPALSQWCFAKDVAGQGFPGGYRATFDRVRRPVLSTFSEHDAPLTKLFHLAARRDKDLTGPRIAGGTLPQAPSLYAALGGFGPAGLDESELGVIEMRPPAERYSLPTPLPKVCALNGRAVISGHGDISVPSTWWALFQQL